MEKKAETLLKQLRSLQKEHTALEEKFSELQAENDDLREREALYRAFIEQIPDAIFAHDMEGRFVYVNEISCLAMGFTLEEALNMTVHDVEYGKTPEQLQDSWDAVMDGETVHTEGLLKRKDGSSLPVDIRIGLFDVGENKFIYGMARDISERKQFEERLRQAHKMEAVGTLAGGIAHDFNNILGIILGCTELAGDPLEDGHPSREYLNEIILAVLRAKEVIRQLLSFSQKSSLTHKPLSIAPLVKESLKLMRATISANIELQTDIQDGCFTVMANPAKIHQMMINLCTNAAHATHNGGIIEVSLKNQIFQHDDTSEDTLDLQGKYLHLSIRDTGCGMPSEVMKRIFDPYFTTQSKGKGSGMGLAVVHGIVQSLDGIIKVDSKIDNGTTFDIFIPALNKPDQPSLSAPKGLANLPTGSEHILVVDDEAMIVAGLKERLEGIGYIVEGATDPLKALKIFKKTPHRFDLLITDMAMPGMTGDTLITKIRMIRSDFPVILCTGFSDRIEDKTAEELGATKILFKPIDREVLAGAVKDVLNGAME